MRFTHALLLLVATSSTALVAAEGDGPTQGHRPACGSLHDHYEAITRGDTLVMALLNLWAAKTRPDLALGLTWSER